MAIFHQKQPSKFALTFSLVIAVGMSMILIIASLRVADEHPVSYAIAFVMLLFLLLSVNSFYLQYYSPETIRVDDGFIDIRTYGTGFRRIAMESIVAIGKHWSSRDFIRIGYVDSNGSKSFYIHLGRLKHDENLAPGKFLETLLMRTSKIQTIELEEVLSDQESGWSSWAKEPDWTIINTAKRRAEENRKKRELTPDPSLTKRGEQDNLPSPSGRGAGGEGRDNP